MSPSSSCLQLLVVRFRPSISPPHITSISVIPSQNSMLVEVLLAGDARVYCAALLQLPLAVSQIVLDGVMERTAQNRTSIQITSLTPITTYYVACVVVSSDRIQTSLRDARNASVITTTKCCKQVYVTLFFTSIPENQLHTNALQISLDNLPTDTVTITVSAVSGNSASGQTRLLYPFFPASVTVTSTTSSKIASLTFIGINQLGTYDISVGLSGVYATEFNVSFPKANRFVVIDAFSAPPVPRVLFAMFADDGATVIITFDSATNQGGVLGSAAFACSRVLKCDGCATTLCSWSAGPSVITLYPGYNSNVIVGTRISILPKTVTAACAASTTVSQNCSSYQYLTGATVTLTKPVNAIKPTVNIAAPTTIGMISIMFRFYLTIFHKYHFFPIASF